MARCTSRAQALQALEGRSAYVQEQEDGAYRLLEGAFEAESQAQAYLIKRVVSAHSEGRVVSR